MGPAQPFLRLMTVLALLVTLVGVLWPGGAVEAYEPAAVLQTPVPTPVPVCGNGFCQDGETPFNCPMDCPLGMCGNHLCEPAADESITNCAIDCFCGDEICHLADGEDMNTCPFDCDFCGDGICEYPYGEGRLSCPQDCVADATFTPTPTLWPTSTPTPTLVLTETATPQALTLTPPGPGAKASPTPTALPTLLGIGGEIPPPASCTLIPFEAWTGQSAYSAVAPADYSIPKRGDDREIFVCEVPPLGRLCFFLYEGLLDAAQGDVRRIALVDCSGGRCRELARVGQIIGDQICYDIQPADGITCAQGCALLLRERPIVELPGGLSGIAIVMISIIGLVIIVTAIILVLLLSRRRQDEDEGYPGVKPGLSY